MIVCLLNHDNRHTIVNNLLKNLAATGHYVVLSSVRKHPNVEHYTYHVGQCDPQHMSGTGKLRIAVNHREQMLYTRSNFR